MSPRRVLRIARWEVSRGVGTVDRRTGALLVGTLLVLAVLAPVLAVASPAPGAGVYRVAVADSNPYHAAVGTDVRLRAVSPGANAVATGRADVAITPAGFRVADSPKGRAALAALRSAVNEYNDRLMARQPDAAAAFPVTVNLTYVERAAGVGGGQSAPAVPGGQSTPTAATGTAGSATAGGSATSGATTSQTTAIGTGSDATGTTSTGATTTGSATTGSAGGTTTTTGSAGGGPLSGGSGGAGPTTPSSLSPPFPLQSLVLAFAFLLPLNVVIQAYGSSVIDERIGRRGEPLLASPASRSDIVFGKALPYFLGAAAVTVVVALAVGAGALAVAAVLPLVGLFLGATFLGALFARSFKELTFVTVAISITLTAYAFVPAVFTEVHPIAAISPLSVVVRGIRGDSVSAGAFALSTVPVGVGALVCYGLGLGVYREEDLFTQKPLLAKARDALAAPLDAAWRVGVWTALFVPFVLVAELFCVAAFFLAPAALAVPVVLALVALVEEAAKSLHVYAGFANARFPRTDRAALAVGIASGVGFFCGEKLLLLTRLVGLPSLAAGRAAFGAAELGTGSLALLVAPLALHVGTASVSALGARRSKRWYVAALAVAVLVHAGYDYGVVSLLG